MKVNVIEKLKLNSVNCNTINFNYGQKHESETLKFKSHSVKQNSETDRHTYI